MPQHTNSAGDSGAHIKIQVIGGALLGQTELHPSVNPQENSPPALGTDAEPGETPLELRNGVRGIAMEKPFG